MTEPTEAVVVQDPAAIRRQLRAYLVVFVALAILTVTTVVASRLHLGHGLAIALAIATLKGGLVATWFMHLRSERAIVFWALALTGILLAALVALPLLTMTEAAVLR